MNLGAVVIGRLVIRSSIRTTSNAITASTSFSDGKGSLSFNDKTSSTDFHQWQLDDEKLALRGDFNGIKSLTSDSNNKILNSPEVVIAKLQEEIQRNYCLSTHKFIVSILQPLEQRNVHFCNTISNSAFLYVPILIKMCGEVMTDVPMKHRTVVLDRLIKSFTNLGIEMSIEDVNAMVQVWLENYHPFNVKELLSFVEGRLNINPDATFFALCAWRIVRLGDADSLTWLVDEIKRRKIKSTSDFELAKIFFLEKYGAPDEKIKSATSIFAMAEACCLQEGIQSVYNFVHNYRTKFIINTHPINSVKYRNGSRRLFLSAFYSLGEVQWKELEKCRLVSELCDFLIEKQFIASRECFVDGGVEFFLQRSMFSEAFVFWRTQVRAYHSKFGLQLLLDYIIERYKEHEGVCRDRIIEVMRESSEFMDPSEFIACVITSIVSCGYLQDAKTFAKLFSLPGSCFSYSLKKLAEKENIRLIENFADFLSEVYFDEDRKRGANGLLKRQKFGVEDNSHVYNSSAFTSTDSTKTISASCEFEFLLNIWKRPGGKKNKKFMRKLSKIKLHKVDVCELDKLAQQVIFVWIKAAENFQDCDSMLRLHNFMTNNGVRIKAQTIGKCRKIFLRNNKINECPFDSPMLNKSKSV